jgi:polysaccharide export outer membrane protein
MTPPDRPLLSLRHRARSRILAAGLAAGLGVLIAQMGSAQTPPAKPASPGTSLGGAPSRARTPALQPLSRPLPVPTAAPPAAAGPSVLQQSVEAAAARPSMASSDYLLQPSDVVSVTVFQEPELTTTTRVAADGTIAFPLIGRVVIGGKTTIAAGDALRRLLDADYLVNPQVSVSVVEVSKRYFTILGQVGRPGTYELPAAGSLPILQAIGLAGGFTRVASPSRITVRRAGPDGKDEVIRVDGKKGGRDREGTPFEVRPGDMVEVPESLL